MNLKEVKHRIMSVKSTQKITSAMKLVSAAKLHRAEVAAVGIHPYQCRLHGILSSLLSGVTVYNSPFTVEREIKRVAIVAVASDRGMCGAFNSNIIRTLKQAIDEYKLQGADVEILPVGKKMHEAVLKAGVSIDTSLLSQAGSPKYAAVAAAALAIMERFVAGALDRVDIVYSNPLSGAKLELQQEQLLPFVVADRLQLPSEHQCDYILEPGREALLAELFPKVIALHLFEALLDSAVAEHSARMLAMQVATDNATDLIAELTLEYNKGRQQAITGEILDIMAGSIGNS